MNFLIESLRHFSLRKRRTSIYIFKQTGLTFSSISTCIVRLLLPFSLIIVQKSTTGHGHGFSQVTSKIDI